MDTHPDLLARLVLTPEILRLVAAVDEFKGRWQALGRLTPDRFGTLKRTATMESVGSSTRIEGAKLTDPEVDALLRGLDVRSFRSRDEEEVAGYAEAMALVFDHFPAMPLTENHLKQLHGVLLKHAHQDARHRGHYKTHENRVEAYDAEGRSLGVIFETASPFDTPRLMTELVDWTRAALDDGAHHPLLVIAVFVVRLLAIHPFEDGNGRLARILTTLLLMRSGYGYVPYSSLERIIEDNKEGYYRSLRSAQRTLDTGETRLGDWVVFLLECLAQQTRVLEQRIVRERRLEETDPLDSTVLELVRDRSRLTVADVVTLTGANRNTVKAHLRRLVAAGHLVLHGRGRGAWYGPG